MDNATFQPPAGASGELTGLLIIKKYLEENGLSNKKDIIVPDSAHGTNPASAKMAGFNVVEVSTDIRGMVNIEDLRSLVNENTAGLMLTNPNTGGLFEENIMEISNIIHENGGLIYYDGANLNAIVGVCRPGDMGFDIVTGGGPGLMQAANMGHQATAKMLKDSGGDGHVHSFGINIKLPFEQEINPGVKISREHERFSTRLDEFMALANVVVLVPGGVGTMLELFYTWQLIQVKHMCNIPIILVGDMWKGLIEWLKDVPMKEGMLSRKDIHSLKYVANCEEAVDAIQEWHELFSQEGENACLNWKKYELL